MTVAFRATSLISGITGTRIRAVGVIALGVFVTIVRFFGTFVVVLERRQRKRRK